MKQRARLVTILSLLLTFITLSVAAAEPADAHRTRRRHHTQRASRSAPRATGFEPSDTVLACIRGPWNGMSMESGGHYDNGSNRIYKGAYQSDRNFEIAYAVALIPAEQWWRLGSDTNQRADRWHPLIQDEMARNAIRRRGLQPWPKPNRVCPRLALV